MPNILTRRIGPFPGWVWGGAAVLGGLLFFYFRKQGQAQQTGGLPAVSPAASAVPFVPSVTVTGIPPGPSSGPTPLPGQSGPQTATVQSQGPGGAWLYSGPGTGAVLAKIPTGTTVTVTGTAVSGPMPGVGAQQVTSWVPVAWGPLKGYLSAGDISNYSGGSGGYGYAGATGYSTPIGGWTVGWQPSAVPTPVSPGGGWGAGSTVNRTGAPRRARRLFGGSGGGTSVNRTGARATRPLRRRTLSGR